jgi:AcrR family transcriptional regulator
MAAKTRPRKTPKQERSRETVGVLVEATGRVIQGEGLRGATTRRIAERAGVSVGSLYQYFPGRDALVAAYLERCLAADVATLAAMVDELRSEPLEVLVDRVARAFLRRHLEQRELYGEIFEAVAIVDWTDEVRATVAELVRMLATHLRERSDVQVRDPELAAFAVVHALRAVMSAATVAAPAGLDEEALGDTMAAMALAALR